MRCLSPRTCGFLSDGKTLCWSPLKCSKEYATFQIPCGKCRACRLENARQTAVRCVHEASMHEQNSFITLTYDKKSLKSKKLQYNHFQAFIKALRNQIHDQSLEQIYPQIKTQLERRQHHRRNEKSLQDTILTRDRISVYVAGEYGDKEKRPHWHALIFNWRPNDLKKKYKNSRGDQVFTSETLTTLWPYGNSELGSVTINSAGYCARYAAKKLVHGPDGSHEFQPVSRRSSKNAIGKSWIEKFWPDVFTHGYVILAGGQKSGVPRYYEKWFKKTHPLLWKRYVTEVKYKIIQEAIDKEAAITLHEKKENFRRSAEKGYKMKPLKSRRESEEIILNQKFDQLQSYQKDV